MHIPLKQSEGEHDMVKMNFTNNQTAFEYALYMIAANVLINNLRVMHNNNFLHNAITVHNYTWALELLDFEMSNSEKYPYNDEVNSEVIQVLYNRELLHTYQVITYIAVVLGETVDFKELDNLFEKKGFSLQRFSAMWIDYKSILIYDEGEQR